LPALSIARNTVLEALREKVFYGLVVFGIGVALLSPLLSTITLGHRIRLITDLSMTGLLAAGMLLAIVLGANAIARDIERRAALPLLAKPIGRSTYLVGRFLGVVFVTGINFAVMALAASAVIALNAPNAGFPFGWGAYFATVGLIFLRVFIIAAVAVTLSSIVGPTVAQVCAVGIALAGHFTSQLKFFLSKDQGPISQALAEVIYRLVPDLGALDSLYELIHGQTIATNHLVASCAYALGYSGLLLILGCWTFARRELS
jgi:Cu-processing system permease protein